MVIMHKERCMIFYPISWSFIREKVFWYIQKPTICSFQILIYSRILKLKGKKIYNTYIVYTFQQWWDMNISLLFISKFKMEINSDEKEDCSFTCDNLDLHFVAYQSIHQNKYLLNCLNQRQRNYNDIWLIYSNVETSVNNIVKYLEENNANMDLDDDILVTLGMQSFTSLKADLWNFSSNWRNNSIKTGESKRECNKYKSFLQN